MQKIKLVGFDWDGTIAEISSDSSWTLIDEKLGCEDIEKRFRKQFYDGEISFSEWAKKSTEIYKKLGLNFGLVKKILDENVKLMPGFLETFKTLKENGMKIAIISGSIENIYDIISEKYGFEVDYVSFATRFLFDKDGKLAGGEFNDCDYLGKVNALEEICKKAGVKLNEVAYIGDSDNDIPIFKTCFGIAFVPKFKNPEKFAKVVVEKKDLREILKYIQ